MDEITKISASMGNLLWLAFSGGEIFLRHDIAEITEVFYRHNRPAIILFPTNGLLTSIISEKMEQIIEQCPKSSIVVKLSLDGNEAIHDGIRGVRGSFKKTLATYEALRPLLKKHANFDLGINTVFCSQNQDQVDGLIDFVEGLEGIETHTVSLIRGSVSDKTLKEVDLAKYHSAIKKLEKNLKKRQARTYRFNGAKLKAAQDILQRNLIFKTNTENKKQMDCFAGKLNVVLSESGDVYPCESFALRLGNVKECNYDMNTLLGSDHSKELIRTIRQTGCFCSHECYVMTNILFNPRLYGKLLQEYMQVGRMAP